MIVDVKDVYNGGSAAAQYQVGHVVRPLVIVIVVDSLIVTDARPILVVSAVFEEEGFQSGSAMQEDRYGNVYNSILFTKVGSPQG